MREDSFPYCIPERRELTQTEVTLLEHLLGQIDDIQVQVGDLKIVARCGCGECPTILFGKSLEDEPITSKDSHSVMDWSGRAANGALVGIGLFARDGMPTELEAWSVDGGEVKSWPPVDAIQPI